MTAKNILQQFLATLLPKVGQNFLHLFKLAFIRGWRVYFLAFSMHFHPNNISQSLIVNRLLTTIARIMNHVWSRFQLGDFRSALIKLFIVISSLDERQEKPDPLSCFCSHSTGSLHWLTPRAHSTGSPEAVVDDPSKPTWFPIPSPVKQMSHSCGGNRSRSAGKTTIVQSAKAESIGRRFSFLPAIKPRKQSIAKRSDRSGSQGKKMRLLAKNKSVQTILNRNRP